jgi:hypothetical protein
MRMILIFLIIISRVYIGINVVSWAYLEIRNPSLHSISEIEFFLVLILLDIWVTQSDTNVDVRIDKE